MPKKSPSATAAEILSLLNKQWASNKDIMKIGGVGLNRAIADRKEIEIKVKEKYGQNCRLPSAQVPMVEVVNFYNININYLKKVSQINDK
nr:MAG TPA: hypothetical protein [Caudoviricetes sp.]